jgi:hypothetical protein
LSFTIGVEGDSNSITSSNCIRTGIYHKGHENSRYEAVRHCTSLWAGTDVTVTATVDHFSYYVVALKDVEQTQLPFLTVSCFEYGRMRTSTRGCSNAEYFILPASSDKATVCNLSSETMHMSYVHTSSDVHQIVHSGIPKSHDVRMLGMKGSLETKTVKPSTQALYATLLANGQDSFKTETTLKIEGTIYMAQDSQSGTVCQVKMLCNTMVKKGQLLIITERALKACVGQFVYEIKDGIDLNQLVYDYNHKGLTGIGFQKPSGGTTVYELGIKKDSVLAVSKQADGIKVQVTQMLLRGGM